MREGNIGAGHRPSCRSFIVTIIIIIFFFLYLIPFSVPQATLGSSIIPVLFAPSDICQWRR